MLPKEALARLKVEQGDALFLTEAPDGYRVVAYDEAIVEQVAEGRKFMRESANVPRAGEMTEPRWIDKRALLLLHDDDLAEHGGLPGVRDEGLLDSALARPRNLLAYLKARRWPSLRRRTRSA